jgi:hypothetical protein
MFPTKYPGTAHDNCLFSTLFAPELENSISVNSVLSSVPAIIDCATDSDLAKIS